MTGQMNAVVLCVVATVSAGLAQPPVVGLEKLRNAAGASDFRSRILYHYAGQDARVFAAALRDTGIEVRLAIGIR